MATQALWQPKEEGLREICGLLQQNISPTSDKTRIWQQLQHFTQFPDFNNYLAFIFARSQVYFLAIQVLKQLGVCYYFFSLIPEFF